MNLCWFTGHKWKIISYWNYRDTSYCKKDQGALSNTVTLQCIKCGNLKTKSNWAGGHIKDEDLLNEKTDK